MGQLIYVPFKCKIKLSFFELQSLNTLLGLTPFLNRNLETLAAMEWAIKKRMDYTRRLISRKKEFTLTFNALDALMLKNVLGSIFIVAQNWPYERVLINKLLGELERIT